VERAKADLSEINEKIIFSRMPNEFTQDYTVQPGDTLFSISRRFNTPIDFIVRTNKIVDNLIKIGQRLRVLKGDAEIHIDKTKNTLTLYINNQFVKTYKVSTGAYGSTPSGAFRIANKIKNPTWFTYDGVLGPDDPENILGTRWMGLDKKGYGIHGTLDLASLGSQVTDGCIRMGMTDIEELYSLVPIGTRVIITDHKEGVEK
jgi:lipoprotein-anchoring transpeptidase ErfK/SrfK